MTSFTGIVQAGKKRGKLLGFPTANIPLPFPISEGIYISQIKLNTRVLSGLTFVGAARTFGETDVISETWILDFDEEIYGISLDIILLKKIRENKKFDSESELIKQMEIDKNTAISFFNKK